MWFHNSLVENRDIKTSINILTTDIYKLWNLVYLSYRFLKINECLQKSDKRKYGKFKQDLVKFIDFLGFEKYRW